MLNSRIQNVAMGITALASMADSANAGYKVHDLNVKKSAPNMHKVTDTH